MSSVDTERITQVSKGKCGSLIRTAATQVVPVQYAIDTHGVTSVVHYRHIYIYIYIYIYVYAFHVYVHFGDLAYSYIKRGVGCYLLLLIPGLLPG